MNRLSFDLWLLPCAALIAISLPLQKSQAQVVTRGPYLQMPTPTGLTVRWRTDVSTVGTVRYGPLETGLPLTLTENEATTEHELRMSDLSPGSTYEYSISPLDTPTEAIQKWTFVTPKEVGSRDPFRFWVLGDPGTGNAIQARVRDAWLQTYGAAGTAFMMFLGDNAYPSGLDSQYQANFFNVYKDSFKTLPIWSCIGNHETYGENPPPYLSIFSFPKEAECGGAPSGTENYFSFDHHNVHFVCLDAMLSSRATTGPMAQWLRADLDATNQEWIVAFWHHPPYDKGTHNSDTELDMIQMRTNIVPILESYGVDLVLCGHSHVYERSHLIRGHYGSSNTFKPLAHLLQAGTQAPFRKATEGPTAQHGTVYVVCGNSGNSGFGSLNHPAHVVNLNTPGSLAIYVAENELNVHFRVQDNSLGDSFSIIKTPDGNGIKPSTPQAPQFIQSGSETHLYWADVVGEQSYAIDFAEGTNPTPEIVSELVILPADTQSHLISELEPGQTYSFRIRARNHPQASLSPWASFTVPAAPATLNPRELWRFSQFGSTTNADRAADEAVPDGDGLINTVEYACDLPAWKANDAPIDIVFTEDGPIARYRFGNRHGIRCILQGLPHLSDTWLDMETQDGGQPSVVPHVREVPLPSTNDRWFVRLKVIPNENS